MDKMRIAVGKTEETKYVGHLDFCRAVERALRRAKPPVAYSVGFNPHMRLSFGPALCGCGERRRICRCGTDGTGGCGPVQPSPDGEAAAGVGFCRGEAGKHDHSPCGGAESGGVSNYATRVAPTPENLVAAENAVAAFQSSESVPYV